MFTISQIYDNNNNPFEAQSTAQTSQTQNNIVTNGPNSISNTGPLSGNATVNSSQINQSSSQTPSQPGNHSLTPQRTSTLGLLPSQSQNNNTSNGHPNPSHTMSSPSLNGLDFYKNSLTFFFLGNSNSLNTNNQTNSNTNPPSNHKQPLTHADKDKERERSFSGSMLLSRALATKTDAEKAEKKKEKESEKLLVFSCLTGFYSR